MTTNDTTFLNEEEHLKTRINHLQKEMEDFKQIKRETKKDKESFKEGENEDEGLKPERRKWLNKQIEKNKQKIEELHQKLVETKREGE